MEKKMAKEIEEICAAKLREIRRKKGLTLHACEVLSNGSLKAVVLGSYERGTRAISLARLEQLAELYEVPIQYFFGISSEFKSHQDQRFTLDLRRIGKGGEDSPRMNLLRNFIVAISRKRSDWNGEILSLRQTDREILAITSGVDEGTFLDELRLNRYIFADEVSGKRSL